MEAVTVLALLRESTKETLVDETEVSVAYSGGLDSSLIAAVAREFVRVRAYTCAVKGSYDAGNAKRRAESESLDLTLIELRGDEIPSAVRDGIRILGTSNPQQLAYTIPILVVLRESPERLVLAGNGADELFGGYAKYASARDPAKLMTDDLEKMMRESETLREAARHMKKRIEFPFASKRLVDFARSLPIEEKITPTARKILLREVARQLGLPSHDLPKKAAQYSSGVLREMRRYARAEGRSLAEWTKHLVVADGRSP